MHSKLESSGTCAVDAGAIPERHLFLFNQFGDFDRYSLRPGNVHCADDWKGLLKPVVVRVKGRNVRLYFQDDTAVASSGYRTVTEKQTFSWLCNIGMIAWI